MKALIAWWYRLSLPTATLTTTPATPRERERLRYARLTSSFLLLILILFLPSGLLMIFDSPPGSSSPFIAVVMFVTLIVSFVLGKLGWQIASAIGIVVYNLIIVTGVLLTNPLDPSLFPIVYTLLFAVILAGALMPPIAAIVVAVINSIAITLIALFASHTAAYTDMVQRGLYSVLIFLPVVMQLSVAVMCYVILRNLVNTIRRADRAEEIVALQQEMAVYEETRLAQQAQLEEGIKKIAEVHARIANGDLSARVSLTEGNVLWNVAVPLNNLLNRLQNLKQTDQSIFYLQQAARYLADQLHGVVQSHQAVTLSTTGTVLDPIIIEINQLMQSYTNSSSLYR
jgi:uncharacterized membrane protein